MRHLLLLPLVAMATWLHLGTASTGADHTVTLHLTSFTAQAVVVHIVQSHRMPLSIGTIQRSVDGDSLTVKTPADVRLDSAVKRVQLSTEGNLAIRVRFTDGASEKERALAPWGRRLTFVRGADGDLKPEAEVMPAQPTRTVFTDSLLHAEQCASTPSDDWRRVCTPRDQRQTFAKPKP